MLMKTYNRIIGSQIGGGGGVIFRGTNGTQMEFGRTTSSSSAANLVWSLAFHDISSVNNGTYSGTGVAFGNGSEPVSADDYCLSGDVIGNITATAAISRNSNEEYSEVTAVYTITNSGESSITISEVGYFGCVPFGATTNCPTMLERTVLDAPITIEAGGVGQVTYTIRMNYPT